MSDWIEPPEEKIYHTKEEAENDIYQYAFDHGFALTRADIKYDKKTPRSERRWDYRCEKGGVKKTYGTQRQTGTRMTECDFELRIHRVIVDDTFKLQVYRPNHNHPPSEDHRQHAQYRRPTKREMASIQALSASGVAPRVILDNLLEADPDTHVTTREILNYKTKLRDERLAGDTPIECLVRELVEDEDWALRYSTTNDGHVDFIFFTPNEMIDIAQASPDVILIDATYRTNKYNLPGIHFMAVTAVGMTASIGLALVANEKEPLYNLAVSTFRELVMGDAHIEVFLTDDEDALRNAISEVYPGVTQLLCLWHVNKNVLAKVHQTWIVHPEFSDETNTRRKAQRDEFMADWQALTYAKTEQDFEDGYTALRAKYFHQTVLIQYIRENKYPKRHLFVKAWTSQVRHLGHTVTSRVESGHSKFKLWLGHNRHDLLSIKDRWQSMTRTFLQEHRKELVQERDRVTHQLRVSRYNTIDKETQQPTEYVDPNLNSQIVDRALKLFVNQLDLARDTVANDSPCSGIFEQIYGIPCYHSIRGLKDAKITIKKGHLHLHWHFERAQSLALPPPAPPRPGPTIFAPHKVVTRGRPRQDGSTRRDPSLHEVVAPSQPRQRPGRIGGETSLVRSLINY